MKFSNNNVNLVVVMVLVLYLFFFVKMNEMKPLLIENSTRVTLFVLFSLLIFLYVSPFVALVFVILGLELLKNRANLHKTTQNVPNPILHVQPESNIVDYNTFKPTLEEEVVNKMIHDKNLKNSINDTPSYEPVTIL